MRVLVVHNQGAPGLPSGELGAVRDEVEALQARGVEVRLHLVPGVSPAGLSAVARMRLAANLFWSVGANREIGRIVDEFKPDVVHFHSILPNLTPSAFHAVKSRGIPVVQTLHNFRWLCVEGGLFRRGFLCTDCIEHNEVRGLYHRCSRGSVPLSGILTMFNAFYLRSHLLFRLVDEFIAVSNFVRNTYVKKGFPSDRVHVKYNGVSIPANAKGAKSRSGIAYVGRLSEAKGTEHLKQIMFNLPDVPFTIVGDGPDMPLIRDFAAAHGLSQVRLLGSVKPAEVYDVLASAECAVVPSVCGETFGRVALEAMTVGTPVVASRIGGLAELTENNAGAIAVDPARSEEFVHAIRAIVGNAARVAAMGREAQRFVQRVAYNERSADGLLAAYERAIARRAR